jgi:Tfp pilus assembly protein PilF
MRPCMLCLSIVGIIALSGCTTTQGAKGRKATEQQETTQSSKLMKLAAEIEARGDTNTAIALYEQAAAASDAPASAFVQVGDVYMRAGYPVEATKAYRTALSRSPNNGPALVGLGSAMVEAGDTEAGIRALAEGAQSVNTSQAYNRLGVAQTFAGQIGPALETFSRALSLAPGDLDIQTNMALAAALAGDSAKALPLIQRVAAAPNAQLHHKRNAVVAYGLLGLSDQVRASPPTGLTTKEIDTVLAQARSIRAKKSIAARANALGAMNG